MADYRAYILDELGRIAKAAIFIRENTDEDAIEAARHLVGDCDVALWQEERHVATLERERRKVEVAYADGKWVAQIGDPISCGNLTQLIHKVQRANAGIAILFVIDQMTFEGDIEARAQFLEISESERNIEVATVATLR